MDKIFKVAKNEQKGWDVVDVRTARPDVGHEGNSVDWQATKKYAQRRCDAWNELDPVPQLKRI